MFEQKTEEQQGSQDIVLRDYAFLAVGMAVAIATTLAVIGGSITGV